MSPSSSSESRPFPESIFVTLGGESLHVRTWQPMGGQPRGRALLLHGFGGSTFSWRFVGPGLSALGYEAVAVDFPGFGYSFRPEADKHQGNPWAVMMWALADRLESSAGKEESRQWILVGHSSGGQVAAGMAAAQPGRVERVVYIDAALFGAPRPMPFLSLPAARWLAAKWLHNQVLTEKGIARLLETAYGRPPDAEEIAGYLTPLLIPETIPCLLRAGTFLPEISEDELEVLSQPALVIWGQKDAMIEMKYALRVYGDLPNAEISIIPEAGHLPMETHPNQVLQSLEEFFRLR